MSSVSDGSIQVVKANQGYGRPVGIGRGRAPAPKSALWRAFILLETVSGRTYARTYVDTFVSVFTRCTFRGAAPGATRPNGRKKPPYSNGPNDGTTARSTIPCTPGRDYPTETRFWRPRAMAIRPVRHSMAFLALMGPRVAFSEVGLCNAWVWRWYAIRAPLPLFNSTVVHVNILLLIIDL